VLLGPADLRGGEGLVLFRSGRDEAAVAIDDEGARSSGADVDSEYVDRASSITSGVEQRWTSYMD
jgi:hypothetical protein